MPLAGALTVDSPSLPPAEARGPAMRARTLPLWAVLTFTFANSIGTGVVTNGIVFMTKHGYGFSDQKNYALGILLGVTYIAGALGAQPLIRLLRSLHPAISTRAILATMMVVMALLCTVPLAARWAAGGASGGTHRSAWPVWVIVTLYSPLTGVLWPLVESYLSGGRSGAKLRSAVGRFNVVWSTAIVVAYVGISRFVESQPEMTIFTLGGVHLLCLLLLARFPSEPAAHGSEDHEPHPPIYSKLLVTFRLLLPLSYVLSSALVPYLPGALTALNVSTRLQAMFATCWLLPRVVTFAVLDRWHGWHGRWFPAISGGLTLLLGFTLAVLAKSAGSLVLLAGGLAVFGVGMAVVYSGALYYALEVGQAEVQAGGKHEALIGVGYTVGPAIFVLAGLLVRNGVAGPVGFEGVVLSIVGVIALVMTALVVRRVMVHMKTV